MISVHIKSVLGISDLVKILGNIFNLPTAFYQAKLVRTERKRKVAIDREKCELVCTPFSVWLLGVSYSLLIN